jgi:hypothetical protein
MDLSLATSVPRILLFYGVLLIFVYPALALVDRVILALKRRRRSKEA